LDVIKAWFSLFLIFQLLQSKAIVIFKNVKKDEKDYPSSTFLIEKGCMETPFD